MYKINMNFLYQQYLCDAISEGDINCIKSLLKHKKDFFNINEVYYRLQGKGTIFFAASSCGQLGILDELIELGADPNIKNIEGDTPLIHAVKRDKYETVLFLLERKSVDKECTDKQGDTALTAALKLNKVEIFKALLKTGAYHGMIDFNDKSDPNRKYFRWFIKYRFKLFKKYLNLKDENYALEGVKQLIDSNIGVNSIIPDGRGDSLLIRAIMHHRLKIATYLIKTGTDINIQNVYGITALDYAMWEHDSEYTKEDEKVEFEKIIQLLKNI